MGVITYNGVSTEELGLISEIKPTYVLPEKDYTITEINGRNGDIVIDHRSYKNVERVYSIAAVIGDGETYPEVASKIANWVSSPSGYAVLSDSYDPGMYRYAIHKETKEISNIYDRAVRMEVIFNCKPQRYADVVNGITVNGTEVVTNPYNNESYPRFMFLGNKTSEFTYTVFINGNQIFQYTNDPSEFNSSTPTIVIDTGKMDCYATDGNRTLNLNKHIEFEPDVTLKAGTNTIRVTSSDTIYTTVYPGWWTI